MPDNPQPPPSQTQLDTHNMLHDLEKAVEMLSDQLDMVKIAMRRLVMAESWLEQAGPTATAPEPTAPAPATIPAFTSLLEPVRDEVALSVPPHGFETATTRHALGDTPPAQVAFDDEEAKREAVRREVEAARAALRGESPPTAAEWQVVTPGSSSQPAVVPELQPERSPEEELRNVEAALAALNHEEPIAEAAPPAGEHYEAWAEAADATSEPLAPDQPALSAGEEAQREAVRQAMKQTRSEMAWGVKSAEPEALAPSPPEAPPAPTEDEEAAREAVRHAVEQARSEISLSGHLTERPMQPVVPKPYTRPPSARDSIPTLTIEDPEARVELARVYNLLKALGVATNASLLNYTSRQVSVALRYDTPLPSVEQMMAAASETFGRQSTASVDGINVMIQLGEAREQAA